MYSNVEKPDFVLSFVPSQNEIRHTHTHKCDRHPGVDVKSWSCMILFESWILSVKQRMDCRLGAMVGLYMKRVPLLGHRPHPESGTSLDWKGLEPSLGQAWPWSNSFPLTLISGQIITLLLSGIVWITLFQHNLDQFHFEYDIVSACFSMI